MKRRFAKRPALAPLERALADLVDALIGEAVDEARCGDRRLRRRLEEGTFAPAELTRQAIASAFRLAYAIVEKSEPAREAAFLASPFPYVRAAAPDLGEPSEANDERMSAVERLAQVLVHLSPFDLDQDVLGEALARLSSMPFARHPAVREDEERRARNAGGSFFTPPALVERLLDATLEPRLDELAAGKSLEAFEKAALNLAIVDPACGSGRFLLAAADRIAARLAHSRALRGASNCEADAARADVVERCLFAADVDPLAIEGLRFRLRRAVAKSGRTLPDVVRRTFCGDALCEIDWNDVLRDHPSDLAGFDLVLGNPPWTSFSGRHRGQADAAAIADLVARYPDIARWPALHSAMLALSAKIVRDGGRIGLVLPLRVADLDAYADLRAGLASRLTLDGPVVDAGESTFADVVQPAGLFVFRAQPRNAHGTVNPWPIGRGPSPTVATAQGRIDELLTKIDRMPKFPPRTFGDPGVHSGNVAAKLILPIHDEGASSLREGRDIVAFGCLTPRRFVRVDLSLGPGEYCRVGPLARYLDTPILLRQTADRPIAARHTERTYFRNSLLACSGVEGMSDLALIAFLNSALYAMLHRRFSGDASQKSFPQVKVRALQNLPLPPIAVGLANLRSLAEEIERHAALAEAAAAGERPPDAEGRDTMERLILRSFGAPEDLAPLALELAGSHRPPRPVQLT